MDGNGPDDLFDETAPCFAVLALRRIAHQREQKVNWNEDSERLCEISKPVSGKEKLREWENEDGEMQQKRRISQIGNHLAREAGAVAVVIGEDRKSVV